MKCSAVGLSSTGGPNYANVAAVYALKKAEAIPKLAAVSGIQHGTKSRSMKSGMGGNLWMFLGVETNDINIPFAANLLETSRKGIKWPNQWQNYMLVRMCNSPRPISKIALNYP